MAGPSIEFWQQRFETGQTGWDRGAPHPQLQRWLDAGLLQPGHSVLVPGCGRGHELVPLARAGLLVRGLDYTPAAVVEARSRVEAAGLHASQAAVEQADVLQWQASQMLDRIYEQTCLCALHPDHWLAYAAQLHTWLKPGGLLLGLFMQARRDSAAEGRVEGPPYHLDINAVRALFPSDRWDWPAPPYAAEPHSQGWAELAVVLTKRG
ncbi:methyltransferase domain-containing protein [Pelomonas sp. SE-A7]|uniref:methyltransferase domain-containing protein n=1 Tax=Pelomonas sp. SE-A7 TaxID=3054953 RepID=UPI00259D06AF|nr:methyltransferase domain-containing protein [Pelomonas sp. SE-A7]MDM4767960.1 methyltransferase domain-containing protein [Pelomonas sp. SE-A7]